MSDVHGHREFCPRALENGGGHNSPLKPPFNGEMHWREDDTCSYCGSLNPDTFMARLEAGDVELSPTDKNYKVYIRNVGGEVFKQTYRKCPVDATCTGPDDCTHWVTRERARAKFYFQHLSNDQKTRFVELYNQRKLQFVDDYGFYVLPYFCEPIPRGPLH